jgi:aminoglycoside phosphotransferase (APT) family kinase protein
LHQQKITMSTHHHPETSPLGEVTPPQAPDRPDAATERELRELASHHGLIVDDVRINEAGLDYRVAFVRVANGDEWVLRIPRRPDVAARLPEERRILDFLGSRLSVATPRWEVCSEQLIAYRRLPGSPGLTLDASGQPVWHFDPSSPEFAAALGRLIAELQAIDGEEARRAGVPAVSAGELRASWRADLARVQSAFEIAPHLLERWEAWLGDDALWPDLTAFSHGELYAAHVLIDTPGRIVGVLDWTTARVGDPAVDFTYQHMMGPAAFEATEAAYLRAGGREHPHLAARCAELAAAAPLTYGIFALRSGDPQHLASAAAQLNPADRGHP